MSELPAGWVGSSLGEMVTRPQTDCEDQQQVKDPGATAMRFLPHNGIKRGRYGSGGRALRKEEPPTTRLYLLHAR